MKGKFVLGIPMLAMLFTIVSCVLPTNIKNLRPLPTNSNAFELGQVGVVITRSMFEGKRAIEAKAYSALLDMAKEKYPGYQMIDIRGINIESFDKFKQKGTLTATGYATVYHRSKRATPLEMATEDALMVALETANIPLDGKISIHATKADDKNMGIKAFDTVEQELFNQGFRNIVDRLDMNVTKNEQKFRSSHESSDTSLVGFFLGADYIVTIRLEASRTTVRILDVKKSTVIGRSSRWY